MANPAAAAIEYALRLEEAESSGEGVAFLHHWFRGDFPEIREIWPGAPESIFIGADPLHPKTKAGLSAEAFGEYVLGHLWSSKLTFNRDGSPKSMTLVVRSTVTSNEHMYGPSLSWVDTATASKGVTA